MISIPVTLFLVMVALLGTLLVLAGAFAALCWIGDCVGQWR